MRASTAEASASAHAVLGERIHVVGNSNAGKSTLAARLSKLLGLPLVELDAINWQPGWVGLNATAPHEFQSRLAAATSGDRWVVAGSYHSFAQRTFWGRLQTLVWLDLPRHLLVARMLKRSWARSRSRELLWGSNREKFWPQLMVWRRDESLLWWIVTQHARKRRELLAAMTDPRWRQIRFIRLTSTREVEQLVASLEASFKR